MKYAELTVLLGSLGFERRVIRGSHVVFSHAPTDTQILLPVARGRARVREVHVVSTRRLLEERGIASARRWARLIEGPLGG